MIKFNKNVLLEFNSYKIFCKNQSLFLYVTKSNALFSIDESILTLLEQAGKTCEVAYKNLDCYFSLPEFYKLIRIMEDKKLIKSCFSPRSKKDSPEPTIHLHSITLMISQECNLMCSYCYGSNNFHERMNLMSEGLAIDAINFLLSNSGQNRDLTICFFGGEPLINFSLIKKIVTYCRKKETETKKFSFTMTSNGTILNNEIETYLQNNKIHLQISIDGNQEEHDKNRLFSDNSGTYETVIKNTESMRKNSCVSARATITNSNLNLISIFEHLENLGFDKVIMAPANNLLTEENHAKLLEENLKLLDFFCSLIKNGEYEKACKLSSLRSSLGKVHLEGRCSYACGAGSTMVAVDVNGDIYPCQRYVSMNNYRMGNVKENEMENIKFLEEIHIDNHRQCSTCWAEYLCSGSCSYENLMATGNVNISTETSCHNTKSLLEKLIDFYLSLEDGEKQHIFPVI